MKCAIEAVGKLPHDAGQMTIPAPYKNLQKHVFLFGMFAGLPGYASAQEIACRAPEPVCAARQAVFVISSFDPVASAVRIAPNLLVTNRHVIADKTTVSIIMADGEKIDGKVIPTNYGGDLVLIEAKNLPVGPVLPTAEADQKSSLFTIGADFSRRKIRVYPPGKLLLKPSKTARFPRLYHTALSQPGNSGGALVDEKGRLIGIITSGGEGRFEAFPITAIKKLKTMSGEQYAAASQKIGAALRNCVEFQEKLPRGKRLSAQMAKELDGICAVSGNRQLMDSAAVLLGQSRHLDLSQQLLKKALMRDPQAINTRLSLITALTFAGKFEDALPHIKILLPIIPEDAMLQRFAVQAGKFSGDMALARAGLDLVKKHNPAQAEAATRFLEAPLRPRPAPKRKPN